MELITATANYDTNITSTTKPRYRCLNLSSSIMSHFPGRLGGIAIIRAISEIADAARLAAALLVRRSAGDDDNATTCGCIEFEAGIEGSGPGVDGCCSRAGLVG
jgi:hypothetical protein